MGFEYQQHTADMKVEVRAEQLEDVFDDFCLVLTGLLTDEQVAQKRSFPIELVSESLESLLFDFLDELIFLLDTESFASWKLQAEVFNDSSQWILDGIVYGDDISKYEHHGDISSLRLDGLL